MPEVIMLTATFPGAIAANTSCTRLPKEEMGAQFVSPSTRVPTTISGSEMRMAAADSHTDRPRLIFCSVTSATASTTDPITTQRMGKSVLEMLVTLRSLKVLTIRFHFRTSAVSPPEIINPTAGHITQFRLGRNAWSGMKPWEDSSGGATYQATTIPSAIDTVTRRPTIIPEATESMLQLVPTWSFSPHLPKNRLSGNTRHACDSSGCTKLMPPPTISAQSPRLAVL